MRLRAKLTVVLAIGSVAALFVWFASTLASGVVHLPDGSTLKLIGVTVGLAPHTTEKSWHRFAKKILPARLQRWLPVPSTGTCAGSSNSITVYFEHAGPAVLGVTPYPWHKIAAADDQGFRFPSESGGCNSGGLGKVFRRIVVRAYPRRQRDFDLLLLGPKDEIVVRVRILNPNHGPFPEWIPERLPITRTNGPIVVTLEGLREEISSGDVRRIHPHWRLQSSDPRWQRAGPVDFPRFVDATGNEGRFLSPKERCWKMKISFAPPPENEGSSLDTTGNRPLEFEFLIDPAQIEPAH